MFLWTYLLAAAGFGAEECCPLLCKLKSPQLADNREQKLSFLMLTRVGGVCSEPSRSKCKRRGYSFSTRIMTKFFELKEEVFFKRMSGILVLQKLEKALVHSGDITLNICFFKVGKRWLYSCHGFLRGSCGSSGNVLGSGLDGPGSIPGVGGGGDFL